MATTFRFLRRFGGRREERWSELSDSLLTYLEDRDKELEDYLALLGGDVTQRRVLDTGSATAGINVAAGGTVYSSANYSSVIGRRYRATVHCRAVISVAGAAVQGISRLQLGLDGGAVQHDIHYLLPGAGTYFASFAGQVEGIATQATTLNYQLYNIGGTTASYYVDGPGTLTLEDVGIG
jgi:hypothetical protein